MTSGELITAVLQFYLNQGGRDAFNADVRRKAEYHLQALSNKAHSKAPWSWKRTSANIALAADGLGTFDFPTNFHSIGTRGGLYISGQRAEIIFKPADVIERMRQLEGGTSTRPQFFGYRDQSSLGVRKGIVHRINSSALTLVLTNYDKKPPLIVDRPIAPTTALGAAGAYTGTRRHAVTYVTADGETEGSPLSAGVAAVAQRYTVTVPVSRNPRVTSRKVYGTENGGVIPKFIATLSDNVTTSYDDNTLDGSLGATAPTYATAVTGLELFPSGYHESVFYEGLKARLMGNQGDLREAQADIEFLAGIRDMWINSKEDRNRVPRMPRYGETARR